MSVLISNIDEIEVSQIEEIEKINKLLIDIENGDVSAMRNMALIYYGKKNYEEAVKYLLMAIELGDIGSINIYGLYLISVTRNYSEAKKHLLVGVEQGSITSMYYVGRCCYQVQDYKEMKKYLMMGIERGDVKAMRDLSLYYLKVEKNIEESKKYMNMISTRHLKKCFRVKNIY
jgi:TPR repeat protein